MNKSVSLLAVSLLAGGLFAESDPFMVSLVTPIQTPERTGDIAGLRLDFIYGQCRDFTGLDIGIFNHTTRDFNGLAIGGINVDGSSMYGVQLGLANLNPNGSCAWSDCSKGVQIGIFNSVGTICGLQDGVINVASESVTGMESALLNIAKDVNGVQMGYYLIVGVNIATGRVRGLQLGLVNVARKMETGVQIGIINVINHGGMLPVCPIFNGSF